MAARLWKREDEENLKYPQPVSTTRVYDTPSYSGQLVSAARDANGMLANGLNGGLTYGSDVGSAGSAGTAGTAGAAGTDGQETRSAWEIYRDNYIDRYNDMYARHGKRAMQDTLGEVSARTGGLASSYAGAVAQETYDNYMAELADKYPSLVNAAYSMYQLDQSMAAPQAAAGVNALRATSGSGGSYRSSSSSNKSSDDAVKKPSTGKTQTQKETEPIIPAKVPAKTEAQQKQSEQEMFQRYNYYLNRGYSQTQAWAAAEAEVNGNDAKADDILGRKPDINQIYNEIMNTGMYSPTMAWAAAQAAIDGNEALMNQILDN